jgi:hypothetical protein
MDDVGGGIASSSMELVPDDFNHQLINLHGKAPVSDVFLSNNYEPFHNMSPKTPNQEMFRFELAKSDVPRFSMLKSIMMQLTLVLMKETTNEDGSVIRTSASKADGIAPISGLLPNFMKQIKIVLNGSEIYKSSPDRFVVTWLETALFVSKGSQGSWAGVSGIDGDKQPGITQGNKKWETRQSIFCTEKPSTTGEHVSMIGLLPTDFQSMNRLLPQQSGLQIDLYKQPDHFLLFGGKNFKEKKNVRYVFDIPFLGLWMKRPLLKEVYFKEEQKKFSEGKVGRMYYYENEILRLAIPQGVSYYTSQNLQAKGGHAVKMFVIFSPTANTMPRLDRNPLEFAPPGGLVAAGLTLDGTDPMGLNNFYASDRSHGMDIILYMRLMEAVQKWHSNNAPAQVSIQQFLESLYIIGVDLTSTGSVTQDRLNMVKQGRINLNMRFDPPNAEELDAYVWMVSPNMISYVPGGTPSISNPVEISRG